MDKTKLIQDRIGLKLVRIGRLTRLLGTQNFNAKNTIITPEQFGVLNALVENNGRYQRQLGYLTLKDRANMTRIVKILESKKLITRKQDVNKRRVYKIFITEEGRKVHTELLPIVLRVWTTCIKNLTDEEVETFINILTKIKENIEEKVVIQT